MYSFRAFFQPCSPIPVRKKEINPRFPNLLPLWVGDKNPKIGIIDYAGTIKEGKFFAFVILKRWVMGDGMAAVSSEARQQIRKTTLTIMNIIAQNV